MQTSRHRDVASFFYFPFKRSNYCALHLISIRFVYAERLIEFSDSRRSFLINHLYNDYLCHFSRNAISGNCTRKSITVNCQTMSIENGHLNSRCRCVCATKLMNLQKLSAERTVCSSIRAKRQMKVTVRVAVITICAKPIRRTSARKLENVGTCAQQLMWSPFRYVPANQMCVVI